MNKETWFPHNLALRLTLCKNTTISNEMKYYYFFIFKFFFIYISVTLLFETVAHTGTIMPRVIGLTGGIASGKSSVSEIWQRENVTIIDADKIARQVVRPGHIAYYLLRRRFGPEILHADGTIDRARLGNMIFSDPQLRVALNRRTHPFILLSMLSRLFTAVFLRWRSVVVLDTPLLFEGAALLPFCSRVVVVYCREEQQVGRMIARDGGKGLSEHDARARLASQIPLQEKTARAHLVIDNSGEKQLLEGNAMSALHSLQPSRAGEFVFRGLLCAILGKFVLRLFSVMHSTN